MTLLLLLPPRHSPPHTHLVVVLLFVLLVVRGASGEQSGAALELQRRIEQLTARALQQQQRAEEDANGGLGGTPLAPAVHARQQQALYAELAISLHTLDTLHPDGGSRLRAAEDAYEAAIRWARAAGDPAGALQLQSSLGALLMTQPSRLQDSLRWLDETLEQAALELATASDGDEPAASAAFVAGLHFNRGKALATAGRIGDADAAFVRAVQLARGRELSTYGKALAAMQSMPHGLLVQALVVLRRLGHDVIDSTSAPPASPCADTAPPGAGDERERTCPASSSAAVLGPWGVLGHLTPGSADLLLLLLGSAAHPVTPAPCDLALAHLRHDMRRSSSSGGSAPGGEQPSGEEGGAPDREDRPQRRWLQSPQSEAVAWLCFGLYKALDARRVHGAAWRALALGNDLMASVAPYDAQRDAHMLAAVQNVFTGPFTWLGPGYGDASPIFVVGAPRSGSTLLESILAAHPDVVAAGEDTALAPLTQDIKQVLMTSATHPDAPRQLADIGKRYVDRMCEQFVPPERRQAAPAAGGAAQACGGVRVVDKQLRNLWSVGYIHLVLPRACVVHVARHPMDAGLSCYAQPFFSPLLSWSWDLRHIASYLNVTWRLAEHWDRTLPGRVHTVYYEQLVEQPEPTIRGLLRACGLTWQPGLLDSFHTGGRPVSTASAAQVRQPLYASSVGRWRAYSAQLAPLRDALGGSVTQYERRLRKALGQQGRAAVG